MRSTPRHARLPVLPVPMPTCNICGEVVTARLCQASPRTEADVEAIQALLLGIHKKLAHEGPQL